MKQKTYYVRRKGTAKIVFVFLDDGDIERIRHQVYEVFSPKRYYLSNDKGETL